MVRMRMAAVSLYLSIPLVEYTVVWVIFADFFFRGIRAKCNCAKLRIQRKFISSTRLNPNIAWNSWGDRYRSVIFNKGWRDYTEGEGGVGTANILK